MLVVPFSFLLASCWHSGWEAHFWCWTRSSQSWLMTAAGIWSIFYPIMTTLKYILRAVHYWWLKTVAYTCFFTCNVIARHLRPAKVEQSNRFFFSQPGDGNREQDIERASEESQTEVFCSFHRFCGFRSLMWIFSCNRFPFFFFFSYINRYQFKAFLKWT